MLLLNLVLMFFIFWVLCRKLKGERMLLLKVCNNITIYGVVCGVLHIYYCAMFSYSLILSSHWYFSWCPCLQMTKTGLSLLSSPSFIMIQQMKYPFMLKGFSKLVRYIIIYLLLSLNDFPVKLLTCAYISDGIYYCYGLLFFFPHRPS